MLRLLAPLAIVSLASTASAATLSWEDVESAEACLSPSSVERQVEARLGRRLNELRARANQLLEKGAALSTKRLALLENA